MLSAFENGNRRTFAWFQRELRALHIDVQLVNRFR